MVRELVRHNGNVLCKRLPGDWKWKGCQVKVIDGTTLTMPDTTRVLDRLPTTEEAATGDWFSAVPSGWGVGFE